MNIEIDYVEQLIARTSTIDAVLLIMAFIILYLGIRKKETEASNKAIDSIRKLAYATLSLRAFMITLDFIERVITMY